MGIAACGPRDSQDIRNCRGSDLWLVQKRHCPATPKPTEQLQHRRSGVILWGLSAGQVTCGAILKEDDVLTGPVQAATIPAAPGADMMRPTQTLTLTSETLLEQVIDSLTDDKAEEVVQIDLRGKTEMADYMVIASGRSTRQVSAMSEKLVDRLKQVFGLISRVEGKETGDWVLIDAGDVIVHIFRPEVREFYQLEKMWLPAGQA